MGAMAEAPVEEALVAVGTAVAPVAHMVEARVRGVADTMAGAALLTDPLVAINVVRIRLVPAAGVAVMATLAWEISPGPTT